MYTADDRKYDDSDSGDDILPSSQSDPTNILGSSIRRLTGGSSALYSGLSPQIDMNENVLIVGKVF